MNPRPLVCVADVEAGARPSWEAMAKAAEKIRGCRWGDMIQTHADWGRDGLLSVSARHLGWRLSEASGKESAVSHAG